MTNPSNQNFKNKNKSLTRSPKSERHNSVNFTKILFLFTKTLQKSKPTISAAISKQQFRHGMQIPGAPFEKSN